jgi:hypothetical protein
VPSSEFKANKRLNGGEINSLTELNYYSDNPLGVSIEKNNGDGLRVPNYSSLKNNLFNNLYRHSGYYSPIFHKMDLFLTQGLTFSGGNYKFDTELTNFGKIKERIVSKVNRQKNILKFKNNSNLSSVYPMIDEFGYHSISSFIFKSNWDFEYHIECQEVVQTQNTFLNQSINFTPQVGIDIPDTSNTSNDNSNVAINSNTELL